MHTYITCALFQGLYSRTLYKMYKILELILIPALTLSALTLHAEPGKQVWLDLLRPTCWAIERRSDKIFLSRGKKPWGQRSTKDHGAVGEWIAPRIWIEVGTGTLAVKGEVESGAKNDDNATGAREDVTSPSKNTFHWHFAK